MSNQSKNEKLKIRPYARLLTMLGDQLIKNELIALTELVKNSYDADADFCNVKFCNFDDDRKKAYNSYILVDDNGYGMSYDVITKHFLNPATPIKKQGKVLRKSRKGRICQGEKGIGRFSMLKLGKKVTIYSKEEYIGVVHKVVFDFTKYDDEFLMFYRAEEDIFLDELTVDYEAIEVDKVPFDIALKSQNHGTAILVEALKGEWDSRKIDEFGKDMLRFCPFEVDKKQIVGNQDFNVNIHISSSCYDKFFDIFHHSHRNIYQNTSEYRTEIKARTDGKSHAGGRPKSRRRGESFDLLAPRDDDRTRTEETDAVDDLCAKTRHVCGSVRIAQF